MMIYMFGDVVIEKGVNWIEGIDGFQVNLILFFVREIGFIIDYFFFENIF